MATFFDPSFRGAGSPGAPGVGTTQRGLQLVEQGKNVLSTQQLGLERAQAAQPGLIAADAQAVELSAARQPGLVAGAGFETLGARDKARTSSLVQGALQLKRVPQAQKLEALISRKAELQGAGLPTGDTDEAIALAEVGDFEGLEKATDDAISLGKRFGLFGGQKGLVSAKTKQFDNGTVQTVGPDGSIRVFNPAGKEVSGADAEKVLQTARQEEIGFAGKKAEAVAGGKLAPEVTELESARQEKLAFTKAKSAFEDSRTQTVSKIGSAKATQQIMIDTVEQIKGLMSKWSAEFGASLRKVPGTEAKQLEGLLTTMRANSAFGTLIDLKESGGTLGAISSTELDLLAAKLGSLDQKGDIEEQKRVLDQILDANQASIGRMETAFESERQRFAGDEEPAQEAAPTEQAAAPELPEGTIINNRATGQRMQVVDGQLVAI